MSHPEETKQPRRLLRSFFKALLWLVVAVAVLGVAAFFFVKSHEEELVQEAIALANQRLATEVQVESVDLSLWSQFPQVSVTFTNFIITESLPGSSLPLARGSHLHVGFSLWDLLRGRYRIRRLALRDAEVTLRTTATGQVNYKIWRETSANSEEEAAEQLEISLQAVELENVQLHYVDEQEGYTIYLMAEQLASRLDIGSDLVDMHIAGQLFSQRLQVGETRLLANRSLELNLEATYGLASEVFTVAPSQLGIGQGQFAVQGYTGPQGQSWHLEGKETSLQTLLSLAPESVAQDLAAYRSEGEVYFTADLTSASGQEVPEIAVTFGCSQARFFHPDYGQSLENASFEGSFTNGSQHNMSTSRLTISQLEATMAGFPVALDLTLDNLELMNLDLQLAAQLPLEQWLQFYPSQALANVAGLVELNVDLKGSVKGAEPITGSGEASLQNVAFTLTDTHLSFSELNGGFLFNEDQLAITDLGGRVNRSDFLLNGLFVHLFEGLKDSTQVMRMEAQLKSTYLDLDELLSGGTVTSDQAATMEQEEESPYHFRLPQGVKVVFECQVDQVRLQRFHGRDLRGSLTMDQRHAALRRGKVRVAGGALALDGNLRQRNDSTLFVSFAADLDHIYLDSAFGIFNNFNQAFLTADQVGGQLSGSLIASMNLSDALELEAPSLLAQMDVNLHQGELHNFEPLLALGRFVDEEALQHVYFDELNNLISISEETIHIPFMHIGNSAMNLSLGGTHTFDEHIDYRVAVPLQTRRKQRLIRQAQQEGAVDQAANESVTTLFLRIEGTTEDFTVRYDTEAVKERIKDAIQREANEFLDLFRSKERQEEATDATDPEQAGNTAPAEEEDTYFDF